MNDEVKTWLIERLETWNDTFQDELDEDGEYEQVQTTLDDIIPKIKDNKQLTPEEYEEVLFHLWQAYIGYDDELETFINNEAKK